jgi:hypothetical protein
VVAVVVMAMAVVVAVIVVMVVVVMVVVVVVMVVVMNKTKLTWLLPIPGGAGRAKEDLGVGPGVEYALQARGEGPTRGGWRLVRGRLLRKEGRLLTKDFKEGY